MTSTASRGTCLTTTGILRLSPQYNRTSTQILRNHGRHNFGRSLITTRAQADSVVRRIARLQHPRGTSCHRHQCCLCMRVSSRFHADHAARTPSTARNCPQWNPHTRSHELRKTRSHYKAMNSLYSEYHNDGAGLEIIAAPCNQFGGQEPGTPAQILSKLNDLGVK